MKVLEMEKRTMKTKRISVSSKRQITIPLEYCKALKIEDEVECIMKDGSIIIRPIKENFSDLILEDLIKEGYEGKKLLEEFKRRKENIKYAIEDMKEQANKVAEDIETYSTIEDVFKEEE